MADSKPAGSGENPGNGQNEYGRPGQRRILQGLEGLLKNLPLTEMSDVVARSSRYGRAKLDSFLLRREREQLLRELGRIVADEARAGRLSLPLSALDTWDRLLGVEARLEEELRDLASSQAASVEQASSDVPADVPGPATSTDSPSEEKSEAGGTDKTIGRRKPRASSRAAKTSSTRKSSTTEEPKSGGTRLKATSGSKATKAGKASAAKRATGTRKSTTTRKTTSAKGAKSEAATAKSGEKEVKKTVGRRAPRKKAAPTDSEGSSQ